MATPRADSTEAGRILSAANLLSSLLCGTNQAPLKRALLDNGFAEDVSLSLEDDVKQPWLCLEVRGLREADIPEARRRIEDTLKQQAEALDRAQLEAEMANAEFQLRERDYGTFPTGLANAFLTLGSWQYGGAPEANLQVGDLFDRLRSKAEAGWFEELINELFLNNPHRCEVQLHPSVSAGEERRAREAARLQKEISGQLLGGAVINIKKQGSVNNAVGFQPVKQDRQTRIAYLFARQVLRHVLNVGKGQMGEGGKLLRSILAALPGKQRLLLSLYSLPGFFGPAGDFFLKTGGFSGSPLFTG